MRHFSPAASFSTVATVRCLSELATEDTPSAARWAEQPNRSYIISTTRAGYTEVGSRIRSILWRRASPEQEQARLTTRRLA
jgi:hypothetical protein